ncbi:MAG: ABC transporter ATP-binding protein [Microthrixaceae bacterium]|nr:ABC transporter ATP-binding protein [Microthrixaceae bacterium]
MEIVLGVDSLRRSFGERVAVDGVGFTIGSGETYGLLGPNGAGKTTTISMVCGLLQPDEGRVEVLGSPMGLDRCEAKSHVGLVPQEVALYGDLTGRENLELFGRLQGLAGGELSTRVDAVLELMGLTERGGDRVEEYSGGMKRRCNIGAALLHHPALLILDEPTVGVDPQSRNAILAGIEDLQAEGMAVLYTTHYMEEAQRLCDRIAVMDSGSIVAEGTTAELVSLVGTHPVVRLSGEGPLGAFTSAAGELPGVLGATLADGRVDVVADVSAELLSGLLDLAARSDVVVSGVQVDSPDLEDVFLHVTGRALRD